MKFWLKFSLLNIFIVAIIGVFMRYKISFEFPYLDQKNLQQSHHYFAFYGWISHTLMTLIAYYLKKKTTNFSQNRYNKIFFSNLICSYGMLFSFIIGGLSLFSGIFSTISILISYVFAYQIFKDIKQLDDALLSKKWFKVAVSFNVFSSLGIFTLFYMMVSDHFRQDLYLSCVYYYLHFQYNGWFFFACMGLFFGLLGLKKKEHPFYETSFKLFTLSCIPSYFLSMLWIKLPIWIYVITVIFAIIQVFTWFKFVLILYKMKRNLIKSYPLLLKYILLFVGFCLSIKLLLQLGSTIPIVSKLAFGFRPIVIAYLHLVLLGIISLFLLFYIYTEKLFFLSKKIKLGLFIFSLGVLLNEFALTVQGIGAFSYTVIPYINETLFIISLILVLGIGILMFFSRNINKG